MNKLITVRPVYVFFTIFILMSSPALAQHTCPQNEEGTVNNVLKIIEDSKGSSIKSIDDFLSKLPDEMRKDFILMTESRSFQESDAKNPRVLLKSPKSEMVVSFNLDPKHRGSDRIEVMYWNAKKATHEFVDLHFEKENQPPKVTENPTSCVKCHQSPQRPNWDPYNFWHGQTPFNRDTLHKGSQEEKIYMNFLDRVEKGESRLKHLKPLNTKQQIQQGLNSGGRYQLRTQESSDGPGVNIFDQMSAQNFCRISSQTSAHANKDTFKYLAWMTQNCASNWQSGIPDWAKQNFNEYYNRRGIKGANGQTTYQDVFEDTKRRQNIVFDDKLARQKLFFKKLSGSAMTAEQEMKYRQTENRESSLDQVAPIRYALEPMGVDVRSWSMSIDPETYTFADVFGGLNQQKFFQDVRSEVGGSCDKARQMSLEAFEKAKPEILSKTDAQYCESCKVAQENAEKKAAEQAKTVELATLAKGAHKLFEKHGCIECHEANSYMGAPMIPFDDPSKFQEFVRGYNGSLTGWDKIIWKRLNMPNGVTGKMPLGAPPIVDEDELATIKAYMTKINQ